MLVSDICLLRDGLYENPNNVAVVGKISFANYAKWNMKNKVELYDYTEYFVVTTLPLFNVMRIINNPWLL